MKITFKYIRHKGKLLVLLLLMLIDGIYVFFFFYVNCRFIKRLALWDGTNSHGILPHGSWYVIWYNLSFHNIFIRLGRKYLYHQDVILFIR